MRSLRTNWSSSLHTSANWEARLVVASTVLLTGLAVADRLVARLIGEFPTSAMLWELRFELRGRSQSSTTLPR